LCEGDNGLPDSPPTILKKQHHENGHQGPNNAVLPIYFSPVKLKSYDYHIMVELKIMMKLSFYAKK